MCCEAAIHLASEQAQWVAQHCSHLIHNGTASLNNLVKGAGIYAGYFIDKETKIHVTVYI